MQLGTTICAISSASGSGAIGIVRVSGNQAFEITENIVKRKQAYTNTEPRKMLFTELVDANCAVVDEVMLAKFVAPHSFTGENMVEIYCHGSNFILHKILNLLVEQNAVLAAAGEFSKRAFLNGKIDLSQAEAIADVIASSTAEEHRIALAQLKGNVSSKIGDLREKMLNLTSLLELELDFSEEEVEFADRQKLVALINELDAEITTLVQTFEYGNAVKTGVPVAIVGEPNVGKSTLLNALLHEDRAIVSNIAGTTRDTIEEEFVLDGIKFRLIDTAGIHEADNEIERLGIERTFAKLKTARIVVLLLDPLAHTEHNSLIIKKMQTEISQNACLIIAYNKKDICAIKVQNSSIFSISALHEENVNLLCQKMLDYVKGLKPEATDVIITNVRHISSLQSCQKLLLQAKEAILAGVATDFIAQDLREANLYLAEILGKAIATDEVLGNIFAHFCIGK